MIIFETIQNHFRIMGILELRSPAFLQKYLTNTAHKWIISILYFFVAIPLFWFIIFEAKTIEDYAEPSAILAGLVLLSSCYWILLWEKKNVIQLIDDLKKLVAQSKLCE